MVKPMTTHATRGDGPERRRYPRIDPKGRASARALDQAEDVVVRDISLGGFLVESPQAFLVGGLHQFRVAASDGAWTTVLTARSTHSRARSRPEGAPAIYLTGFEFVEPKGEHATKCLQVLIGQATSVVSY